jgi:curli biogenesis system outer membrane secretion channel CsgG
LFGQQLFAGFQIKRFDMKRLLPRCLFTLSVLLLAFSCVQAQTSNPPTNRNRPKPKTTGTTRDIGQPQTAEPAPAKTVEQPAPKPVVAAPAPQPVATSVAKPVSSKRPKVMVLDFDARGLPQWWGSWDVGSLFGNIMVSRLSRTEMYDVVERARMHDLIQEQNLSMDERFKQDKITKIGRLLGADYILFGYLTNFSRKKSDKIFVKQYSALISYSIRLIDIASGTVVKSAEIDYVSGKNSKMVMSGDNTFNPNDPDFLQSLFGKAINESVEMGVERLTGERQMTVASQPTSTQPSNKTSNFVPPPVNDGKLRGFIAAVEGESVIINRGQTHGVKVGDVFEVTRGGVTDPETGKVLRAKVIAEIKITNVDTDSADASFLSRKEKVVVKDSIVLKAENK